MEQANRPITPPHSRDSEMMVLGCMLTSVNSLNAAADALDDSDFYFTEHKIIFQALKTAFKSDRPADVHLICEELKRQEKLASVGGVGFVTHLAQFAGTSAYIEEYVDLVRSKSILRRMILSAQEIEKRALENPSDVHAALDEAQQKLFAISQSASPGIGVLISDLLSGTKSTSQIPYLKELQEKQETYLEKGADQSYVIGLPTHFIDMDKMLNGFNPSNLIILAARPAMGKTALALNIAENVCFRSNIPVGIFSLEMSAEQLLHRIICSQAEVESEKIKTGALSGVEYQRIVSAVNMMQKYTMVIDDQPGLKITDLRARARRMKEAFGVQFIVIDYLQLLSGSGFSRSAENRQNEISEISRMLKNLARELNVPVLCLSQLSRKVEERAGHKPMLSDLRESGCLTGDTLITDAKTGHRYTIQELAKRKKQTPISVFAVDSNFQVGEHKLVKAFYSGKKQVFELRTRQGKTIKASANHPFLVLSGWKRLDQLAVGDRIACARNISIDSSSKSLNDQETILLAHLLGDGCILPNQPYHYTSADTVNLNLVQSTAQFLFGINSRCVKQKNWYHLYLPSPHHLTHKKPHPITNWFENLGLKRVRSYEKQIPQKLFESDENTIRLFLKHLWATDGNISRKLLRGRKDSAAIYYASSSPQLASQVQHLLHRSSIQSTLTVVPSSKGYRNMYHVHVQGKENQLHFLREIGCVGKRSEIIPELIQNLENIEPHINYDVIPKEAWSLYIDPARKRNGLTWRTFAKELGMSYCGSSLFKSGISRERLQKINAFLHDESLQYLCEANILWDEIVSITPLGEVPVYDATVEGVHNFLANDIFVHNSIEQDSDVVMFLFRREYYDPYDKPGQAEVIVAKNRHGGVGTLQLTYRKEMAQFANHSPVSASAKAPEADPFASFK